MYAVLLDFNGTMFFDTRFHLEAWGEIHRQLCPNDTTPIETLVCGPRNEQILKNMASWLSEEELRQYSERKEELYRSVCRRNPESLHLAAGTEKFLQTLQREGVPFTMASASIKTNIDFYFETFGLGRWFKKETVVYDDGSYADKGEMHLEAARRLNVPFSECMVIEDSASSIALARKNGAGRIVAVGETGEPDRLLKLGAQHFIRDFTQFDCSWLQN